MAIGQCQGGSQLVVTARHAIRALEQSIDTLRIWWMLGHMDSRENDLVDAAAKVSAAGISYDTL